MPEDKFPVSWIAPSDYRRFVGGVLVYSPMPILRTIIALCLSYSHPHYDHKQCTSGAGNSLSFYKDWIINIPTARNYTFAMFAYPNATDIEQLALNPVRRRAV